MLRIVVAGAVLQPHWTGGERIEARILEDGLVSRGHEVHRWAFSRDGWALGTLAASPVDWDFLSLLRYQRLLRTCRPDVVLGFYDYDTSLCRAAASLKIPFVSCAHIYWPVCPVGTLYIDGSGPCDGSSLVKCVRHLGQEFPDSRLPTRLRSLPGPLGLAVYSKYAWRAASLARADAIIVPSERMAATLTTAGLRRVHVVPDAVALNEFMGTAWSGGPKEVLLPSASGTERKGLAHFVAMASRVTRAFPETRFVATNFRGAEAVQGTQYLSRPAFLERLRRAYLVVVPSLWEEPFGLVLTEAMAAGRPVVAYDSGAAREIVLDGVTGLLVPKGDIAALATAVERLLSNEALAQRLGLAGRQRVAEVYSAPSMVDGYLKVIESVLD